MYESFKTAENQFWHVVNNTYLYGIPIDHFLHVIVCFTLFLIFRLGLRLKTLWCMVLIILIGLWKIWYSWGAMLANGRFENPPIKMMDNMIGAFLGYLVARAVLKWREKNRPGASLDEKLPGRRF